MSRKKIIPVMAIAGILLAVCLVPGVAATPSEEDCEPLGEKWGFRIQFVFAGADALGVEWDFGDGSEISTEWNPLHTYPEIRGVTYIVTQTVWNHHGLTQEQIDNGERTESVAYYSIRIMGDPIVTFETGGGTEASSVTAKFNKLLTAPEDPVNGDHEFLGWFKDPACKEPWDFDTDLVMESVTLYAKWEGVEPDYGADTEDSETDIVGWIGDNAPSVAFGGLAILALAVAAYTRNPRFFMAAVVLALIAAGAYYLPQYVEVSI